MRVIVVAEREALRDHICLCLEPAGDMDVAGQAADMESALKRSRALHPDVIVVDDHLPPMRSGHAAAYIKRWGIPAAVLAISRKLDPSWIRHSYRIGVFGFLHEDEIDAYLVEGVRTVHRGNRYFSPKAWISYHSIEN